MVNKKIRILCITDHLTHCQDESIYPLLKAMSKHSFCESLYVASRGNPRNLDFFNAKGKEYLEACLVDSRFAFEEEGKIFLIETQSVRINSFDVIFLRMDRPVPGFFLEYLEKLVKPERIINNPEGIRIAANKKYLLNYPDICPPVRLCQSIEDIDEFKGEFPIVLKPLENYGGQGLVRIDENEVEIERKIMPYEQALSHIERHLEEEGAYLAMKFMRNVIKGDKRVLIVNGQAVGAMLRLPPDGSYICNMSQGGTSHYAKVDSDEHAIIAALSVPMNELGVVVYSIDTLEDDDGVRKLSEINALNVGGFIEAERHSGLPVIRKSAELIWKYILEKYPF